MTIENISEMKSYFLFFEKINQKTIGFGKKKDNSKYKVRIEREFV